MTAKSHQNYWMLCVQDCSHLYYKHTMGLVHGGWSVNKGCAFYWVLSLTLEPITYVNKVRHGGTHLNPSIVEAKTKQIVVPHCPASLA